MGSWVGWKTFHEVAFPCYVSQLVSHCMKAGKQPNKQNSLLKILFRGLALCCLTLLCEYPRERKREEMIGNFCFVISFGTQGQERPESVVQKMQPVHCMTSITPLLWVWPSAGPRVIKYSHVVPVPQVLTVP